ncbi:thiamine pyrophosphokinase [Gemmobacter aquatilis]|uniref:Thiamine diphosphokinase n=1 Tax=Gemmobacter aquatilis TaxID=933059 RepID=A0A1H8J862_9RHOB|nr:thiamine diphosphokinase [Gemmobacter aquatilis]SEN76781.1 thiamine pyrophosphokinase [Gemmobacter aquatilis]
MNHKIVESHEGVTLVAGGPCTRRDLSLALRRAPCLVAADGGADRALDLGEMPRAVIGDFDSVSVDAQVRLAGRLFPIAEQETTDFDKALRSIRAPFVLGVGVAGGRVDHELAVLNGLVRHAAEGVAMPCLLIGAQDVIFAAPLALRLHLRAGDRLSLFPLAPVRGESRGLRWPINGLGLAPDGRVGTSNLVETGLVDMRFESSGMLVILPRNRLDAALAALKNPHR